MKKEIIGQIKELLIIGKQDHEDFILFKKRVKEACESLKEECPNNKELLNLFYLIKFIDLKNVQEKIKNLYDKEIREIKNKVTELEFKINKLENDKFNK